MVFGYTKNFLFGRKCFVRFDKNSNFWSFKFIEGDLISFQLDIFQTFLDLISASNRETFWSKEGVSKIFFSFYKFVFFFLDIWEIRLIYKINNGERNTKNSLTMILVNKYYNMHCRFFGFTCCSYNIGSSWCWQYK